MIMNSKDIEKIENFHCYPKLNELNETDRVELAEQAIENMRWWVASRIKHVTMGGNKEDINNMCGLITLKEIVENHKEETEEYYKGIEDGKELVHSELDPMIRALVKNYREVVSDPIIYSENGHKYHILYLLKRLMPEKITQEEVLENLGDMTSKLKLPKKPEVVGTETILRDNYTYCPNCNAKVMLPKEKAEPTTQEMLHALADQAWGNGYSKEEFREFYATHVYDVDNEEDSIREDYKNFIKEK